MDDLPFDIQSKILSHVPHESVLDCKLVSKTWKTLLVHRKIASGLLIYRIIQKFDKTTYAELRFGYNDEILSYTPWTVKDRRNRCLYKNLTKMKHPLANICIDGRWSLIGSCNGLICLSIHDDTVSNICVFNPFTEECFNLPTIDCQKSQIGIGFGYNASGRNYKVIQIQYNHINKKRSVQVYTLGGDSSGWRNIGETNSALDNVGILWNGSLHWFDTNTRKKKIVAFNLADETFRYLPITPSFRYTADTKLTLLGGYLSIVSMDGDINRTKIWSFKNKRNDDFPVEEDGYYPSWDWSLEFSIPLFRLTFILDGDDIEGDISYEPFGVTENNEVFLWYKKVIMSGASARTILCRYDPKTDTLNKTLHCGVTLFHGIPHVNSMVSLKALGVDSKTIDQFLADCAECRS